jgi:hypothetical protein
MLTEAEFNSLEQDTRDKLTVLVERLEFIEHLQILRKFIIRKTEVSRRIITLSDNPQLVEEYTCVLLGHDLAGANFDIEAMIFYLLLTCIDTIKGQPKPVNVFDWLCEPSRLERIVNQDQPSLLLQMCSLKEIFRSDFGLSRRFKEAFACDLSDELQEELASSLVVCKVHDSEIDQDSLKAWNRRSTSDKSRKLSDTLYSIRSSFTHASVRTFFPVQCLDTVPSLNGEQLLCKLDANLLEMLTRVIKHLISTQLMENC